MFVQHPQLAKLSVHFPLQEFQDLLVQSAARLELGRGKVLPAPIRRRTPDLHPDMLQLDTHETAQAGINHMGVFQGQEIATAKVVMLLTGGECGAVTKGYDGGNPGSVTVSGKPAGKPVVWSKGDGMEG